MRETKLAALAALLGAMGLIGCGSSDEAEQPGAGTDTDTANVAANSEQHELGHSTSRSDTGSDAAGVGETGGGAAAGGVTYAYTTIDLDRCTVTDSNVDEGGWAERRCPGHGGLPLFVDDGDGRFDIDAGMRNSGFDTLGAFNNPPETVEWRMRDGVPFAIIYRLHDVSMETSGRSVLFVETVGRPGEPGCVIGRVAGNLADANLRAREMADQGAAGFDCDSDQPVSMGDTL